MIVTRRELQAGLDRVAGRSDSLAGIHGPNSHAWRIHRESALFLGGARAALLQLAHPYVAFGIDQHSKTRTDIQGRFRRTFVAVGAMSWGCVEDACRAARVVHAVHSRVTGTITDDVGVYRRGHAYAANDVGALLWVHATLVDTAILMYERCVDVLTEEVKDAYYRETKNFAALFGIPPEAIPADYAAFVAYVADMIASRQVSVSPAAREMASFLFRPPRRAFIAIMPWYRTLTAGLLPAEIRDQYRLPFGRRQRAVFARSLATIGRAYRLMPGTVRYLPVYHQAMRRIAGKPPSRWSVAADKAWLSMLG